MGNFEEGKTIHWNMGGHYAGTHIWTEEVRQFFFILLFMRVVFLNNINCHKFKILSTAKEIL
jgi:hypothetical protein